MTPRGYDKYFIVIGAGRNRKFVRFTDSERCAHVFGVLSLAAQSPHRGFLLVAEGHEVGAEEVANEAGGQVTVRVAQTALEKLKNIGVLLRDDEVGAWYVNGWWDVNPDPRNDTSNADRQRRYRERHNGTRNASRNGSKSAGNNGEVEVEDEVLANARILSRRLAGLIERNDPKAKPQPDSAAWLKDMRLLIADRNGDVDEVVRIVDWCQNDQFWRCNILSPAKLRKQFTQLILKAEKQPDNVVRRESASDWLRDINGGAAS